MNRRRFLAVAGATTLAGCADGATNGSPPDATNHASGGGTSGGTATGRPSTTSTTTSSDDETTASTTQSDAASAGTRYGVSLSPRSFGGDDFTQFFEEAGDAGSVVRWAGDWRALTKDGGAPTVVATVADEYGLEPFVETGVYSVGGRRLFAPLDGDNRRAFREAFATFAATHRPSYLGLGVEVNVFATEDPAHFETYVQWFEEAAEAVRDASPGTAVVVTFQYEWLRGLRGGLFGRENDPETAQWDLLDRFDAADVVSLTTFPGLVYPDPSAVPADHYDPLASRVERPLAVTETTWNASTVADGWESDEAEQARWATDVFDLTAPLDLDLLLWTWLYQQGDMGPAWEATSLRRSDGTPRAAWDAWTRRVAG